jgi:hypothetical protein
MTTGNGTTTRRGGEGMARRGGAGTIPNHQHPPPPLRATARRVGTGYGWRGADDREGHDDGHQRPHHHRADHRHQCSTLKHRRKQLLAGWNRGATGRGGDDRTKAGGTDAAPTHESTATDCHEPCLWGGKGCYLKVRASEQTGARMDTTTGMGTPRVCEGYFLFVSIFFWSKFVVLPPHGGG